MNRLPFFALLVVLAAASASAEPLSRAQAVARALERNPTVLRSFADRSGLRGRAKQARADALPEVSVYGTFLRYQDPGFFNSPNIDEFPPEILQAFRPIASNLWDGYGSGSPDTLELQPRQGDPRRRLRGAPRRRERPHRAPGRGAARDLRLQRLPPRPRAGGCRGEGRPPEGDAARDVEEPPRRRRLDRARRPALRGRPRQRPHHPAASSGSGRPRPRGPQRGHGGADRQADRAHGRPRVPGDRGRRGRPAAGGARGDREPARGEGRHLEREDLRRGHRHLQGRHAAPARLQRRLRVVGAGHRQLLRVQLQEVEPRRDPEDPGLRRLAHRGQGGAGPRRPREGRPGPGGHRDPDRPRGQAGRRPPAGGRERLPRGGAQRRPGPKGPGDDRRQLPPGRRHPARRPRRPGRAHPGGVRPRRGPARARQRPRGPALRDGSGPAGRRAGRPPPAALDDHRYPDHRAEAGLPATGRE